MRIIRRVIGGFFIAVGSFFLFILILIPVVFSVPTDDLAEINWSAVLLLAALQLGFMTAGFLLFRWEHYRKKWQEHERRRKEAEREKKWQLREERTHPVLDWLEQCRQNYFAVRLAKEQAAAEAREKSRGQAELKKQEKEQKKRLLSLPSGQFPQQVSIHYNRHAGVENYLLFLVFFLLAAGSLLSIPALVAALDRRQLGIAACILTVTFWIGFVGAIFVHGDIEHSRTRAFLTTNERIVYYVQLAPRNYGPGPVTKIGTLIHNSKVISMDAELRGRMEQYLHSDAFLRMAERVVNDGAEPDREWLITRLNSPGIVRAGMFGSKIRYWDEREETWTGKKIPKSNEGYERICDIMSASEENTLACSKSGEC